MNFKAASLALRHIRATRPSSVTHRLILRVAARRIIRALSSEYDLLLRLQMLEGAAGVRQGSWWTKGRRGLKAAADAFDGTSINPEWLSAGNTGMASYVLRAASNAVREFRLTHISGEDIVQNALMGLYIDGSPGAVAPAYSAGKTGAAGIKSGKETPKKMAHVLASHLKDKVSNETKKLRKMDRLPEAGTDEGGEVELPGKVSPEDPAAFFNWFAWITFENMGHQLGKKIRKFMRDSWKGTGQEKSMDIWLDSVESGKRLDMKEIAAQAGIAPRTFTARHFTPAWRRFAKSIWNSPLVREIKQTAADEGILWVPDKPDLEKLVDQKGKPILRKRKRSFREIVARITDYWMLFR